MSKKSTSFTKNTTFNDYKPLPEAENKDFDGVTAVEKNEDLTLDQKFSVFAVELRKSLEKENELKDIVDKWEEAYNKLNTEHQEIILAKTDPIKYINEVFCVKEGIISKLKDTDRIFRHAQYKSSWMSLENYKEIKDKVINNPIYFYKKSPKKRRYGV